MRAITLSLFVLITLSQELDAQDIHDRNISTAFEEYKEAYLSVDRTKLLSFVYPHIIQISGGADYVMEDMTIDYNMYASSSLILSDLILKQGSKVVEVGEELQAMFPYERHLKKAQEEIIEKGFFLVVSTDEGDTWSFTDMKKYDKESIKIFVPTYHERFNIYLSSIHK